MDSFNETIDKLSNEKLQQGKTNLSYEDDTEPHKAYCANATDPCV